MTDLDKQIQAQKQEYLTQEIKKRGFDVVHFANFLSQKKDNGTNVDVWTIDELKKVQPHLTT